MADVDAISGLPRAADAGGCRPERRSTDGQVILGVITKTLMHASDLRFWVELRGFEPLTPSMRTERAAQQSPSCPTLPQVSGRFPARITASDRTCQRLAAPSSLPESDTGDWVSSIAWRWRRGRLCLGSARRASRRKTRLPHHPAITQSNCPN